jgi:hypothetical protein
MNGINNRQKKFFKVYAGNIKGCGSFQNSQPKTYTPSCFH